jgi:NAD(P)-dependent dehydrogenase (short-subunit alcohol dehydrogenase family)
MISKTVETYGRLDCAFNNVGTEGTTMVSTIDYQEADWNRVLSINPTGVWLCMKYEITQMLRQSGGAIVNTASVAGSVGSRGSGSAYAARKHDIVGLTKTAALEYAKQGLRVNCVCPGVIRTPMMERMLTRTPELEQRYIAAEPIGRLGRPRPGHGSGSPPRRAALHRDPAPVARRPAAAACAGRRPGASGVLTGRSG